MRTLLQAVAAGFQATALATTILIGAGCASLAMPGASSDDAAAAEAGRSRAERVFLYQSRIADALLDRYPLLEIFAGADPALVSAEARMTEACGPLTQAMLARVEGREPSLLLRFEVMITIDECERAAQRTEGFLPAADRPPSRIPTI